MLQDYISDLCTAVLNGDNDDFALECLGILANLTIPDLDYELILKEYDMIPWIKSKLQPGIRCFVFLVLLIVVTVVEVDDGSCAVGEVCVCWLLIVPATCECISGTDLHRQLYVLPH